MDERGEWRPADAGAIDDGFTEVQVLMEVTQESQIRRDGLVHLEDGTEDRSGDTADTATTLDGVTMHAANREVRPHLNVGLL